MTTATATNALLQCDNCLGHWSKVTDGKCDLCVKALAAGTGIDPQPISLPNLHQRINAVRGAVERVKLSKGEQGMGVKWKDVSNRLRDLMVEHGITGPWSIGIEVIDYAFAPRKEGGPKWEKVTTVHTYELVNADDLEDRQTFMVVSTGLDNSDKAGGKESTYGAKETLRKAFMLEESEEAVESDMDPDADDEQAAFVRKVRDLCQAIHPKDPKSVETGMIAGINQEFTQTLRNVWGIPNDRWEWVINALEKKLVSVQDATK